MKRLLMVLSVFGVMLTSCSKQETLSSTEEYATICFNVGSPTMATRYGEGTTANRLYYAVYNEEEGLVPDLLEDNGREFDFSEEIEMSLIQGRSYDIIFWAQAEDAPYEIVFGETGDVATDAHINITDIDALLANNEAYDAFFSRISLEDIQGSISCDVDLVRPFAQLNVATADTEKARQAGLEIKRTGVQVTGVYSSFNLYNGEVMGEATTATFMVDDKAEGTITTNNATYDYLAMNYLLVGKKKLVDIKLFLQEDNTSLKTLTRTYTSVPVQRNYRTNIIGNILTSDVDFDIDVAPGFEEDGFGIIDGKLFQSIPNYDTLISALNNPEVEVIILTDDIDLDESGSATTTPDGSDDKLIKILASRNLTLNLNGNAITGSAAKGDGAIIENEGSLTIVGGSIKNKTINGDAVINSSGELVLDGVKIEGAPIDASGYPSYAVYTSGSLVVENNAEVISDRGALYMSNGADVTINNGTFIVTNALGSRVLTAHVIYADGYSSTLTINDGNFAMNYEASGGTGASVICPAGATINVYDGIFNFAGTKGSQSGIFQNYMGYGAPVNVYGGTYNDQTAQKNLATGCTLVDNGDGTWTVQ